MALFHLSVTQTKRSAGQSAIASAAYRAGERLYSEYYGEYSDYTRKGGVIEELIEAAFHMEAYTPPRRSWMICGLESVVIDFISFQESGRAWWYTLSRLSVVLMLAG